MNEARFGNRRVPKMYEQVNVLRRAVASEGSPLVQLAWGDVEQHIDYAYGQISSAPEGALENLRNNQHQADADGTMVTVSRQALEEVLQWLKV